MLAWWANNITIYWKYMSSISWFINYLYCWIYGSYILQIKLNKILQEPDCFLLKLKITLFYFLFFIFSRCTTHYHSLSLLRLVVIQCHLLSLVVIRCTTCCHSLYQSLLFVVTRCSTRYHLLSLVVSFVCLSINDHEKPNFLEHVTSKIKEGNKWIHVI